MGRKGSYSKHLDLVNKIRHELPDSMIRSTIMLGHPGEGKKEFLEVKSFLEEAKLDWVGFFTYSREEDTKSYKMRGSLMDFLNKKIAEKRKMLLEDIQSEITPIRLQSWIGQIVDVLIEEKIEDDAHDEIYFIGRCSIDAPEVDGSVVVKSSNLKEGDVVKAKILKVASVDLIAEVVE